MLSWKTPGGKFFPTRGVHGSTYMTDDGESYCRTPHGTVRFRDKLAGRYVHALNRTLVERLNAHKTMVLQFSVAAAFGGALLALFGAWLAR